jgi:hypothetical protein
MSDPGFPVLGGLLAVPVIVFLLVLVLALLGGRWTVPAADGAAYDGSVDFEEPEDIVADFDPWPVPYAPAPVAALPAGPAPSASTPSASTAMEPRSYGSLARRHAYDEPYDQPYTERYDQPYDPRRYEQPYAPPSYEQPYDQPRPPVREPYWGDDYGPPASNPYGRGQDGTTEPPAGFPYGP